jgi:hypothetical protein
MRIVLYSNINNGRVRLYSVESIFEVPSYNTNFVNTIVLRIFGIFDIGL